MNKTNQTVNQELLDTLIAALPYVEMAEHDDAYKPGAVARMVRQMRAAIEQAEASDPANLVPALALALGGLGK